MAFVDAWARAVRGSTRVSRSLSASVLPRPNGKHQQPTGSRGICKVSSYDIINSRTFSHHGSPGCLLANRKLSFCFHKNLTEIPVRHYASPQRKDQLVESSDRGAVSTATEKVKQAGKDATYIGIVLLGIGVTGVMFFAIGRELLSSQSPSGVYAAAFKRCKNNGDIQDLVGLPMKGYGETTRRGRRRHVSHTEYERDGYMFLRMKFYIEGPMAKGTVQVEMKKGESGKWEYRYLFVDVDSFPRRTVIIEDNR